MYKISKETIGKNTLYFVEIPKSDSMTKEVAEMTLTWDGDTWESHLYWGTEETFKEFEKIMR